MVDANDPGIPLPVLYSYDFRHKGSANAFLVVAFQQNLVLSFDFQPGLWMIRIRNHGLEYLEFLEFG